MTYSILISSKHLQSALEVVVLLAVLTSLFAPSAGGRWWKAVELRLHRCARRRWTAILIAALFPMIVRVAILPVFPVPLPYVHDEFSYLLMADTFAHGRITNPPPPAWRHFETEYVLVHPTYASQYQPAQGLAMAAGQIVTGQPWWGVWASVGVMCGAICWALSGVFPPWWALCGALGAALQFGLFGFWMNSYFGGAVAAAGGALIVGALLRIERRPISSGLICGLGIVVLLASRPLEGALWAVVSLIWMIARNRDRFFRTALPALAVCGLGLLALAYYNYRVTSHPLEPPYVTGRVRYGTPQSFWWQPPVRVASFDNVQLRENYLNQLALWSRRSSPKAMFDSTWRRLRDFWRFFIGPFFTPALLFLVFLWRDRRVRPWLYVTLPFLLDHATYHAWYPQQSAAETVLVVMLLIQCWRHLRVWQRRRGWGLAMSRNLIAGFALAVVLITVGHATENVLPTRFAGMRTIWASLAPAPRTRDHVVATLQRTPGKHLVFVYYGPGHAYIDEWVFNKARIPGAPIVFARLINPEADDELIRAMPGYDVWLADPDAGSLSVLWSQDRGSLESIAWPPRSIYTDAMHPEVMNPNGPVQVAAVAGSASSR